MTDYAAWPGFVNPKIAEPTTYRADDLATREANKAWWHPAWCRLYSGWGKTVGLWEYCRDELTASRKKSVLEAVCAAAVGLLMLPQYRDLIDSKTFGWPFIWACGIGATVLAIWNRVATRQDAQRSQIEIATLIHAITNLSRTHLKEYADGKPPSQERLRNTAEVILAGIVQIARAVLRTPEGVQVYSNLMIPMSILVDGRDGPCDGCAITCYSQNRPATPAWTRLAKGDLGAGRCLKEGSVEVVEDTHHPRWHGIFGNTRTHSFVSLPVVDSKERVMAIVNIDADHARVFTRKESNHVLFQVLRGPLATLADILYATRQDALVSRARNPRRKGRNG